MVFKKWCQVEVNTIFRNYHTYVSFKIFGSKRVLFFTNCNPFPSKKKKKRFLYVFGGVCGDSGVRGDEKSKFKKRAQAGRSRESAGQREKFMGVMDYPQFWEKNWDTPNFFLNFWLFCGNPEEKMCGWLQKPKTGFFVGGWGGRGGLQFVFFLNLILPLFLKISKTFFPHKLKKVWFQTFQLMFCFFLIYQFFWFKKARR